jgi:plasmid stabilization system protein ParE
MVKIIWTQRSVNDLRSIAEYISRDSVKYASLTLERIIDVTKYIEANPRIGRMVPEMGRNDKIREIIFGNFRIISKISNTLTIYILTVHHSSKRLRQTSLRGKK